MAIGPEVLNCSEQLKMAEELQAQCAEAGGITVSRAEVERFVDDLAKDDTLLEKVKPNATGLASVVATGKKHGYNFTLDEAKSYIQSRSPRDLTDKQLDAIVGGKHHSRVATSTKVVQTAAVATTAVEAAEAATTVVEAAEAVVVVAAVLI